jgi:predicted nucleotidyltransferase
MTIEKLQYGLSNEHINAIKNVFSHHAKLEKVILYGSRAKGNYKPASDIDLTLIGNKLTFSDLAAIDNELDDLLLPYTFDISIYHQIENPDFIDHIKRIGIEFWIQNPI